MKAHIALLALVLWAAVLAVGQAASGGPGRQPATSPNAQSAPGTSSDASANPPADQNDSALQQQIENALRNQPALNHSHIVVNVSGESINLSGTVGSGKDKQTAERIAQSFDGNRKLNDALMIAGQKPANLQASSETNNPPNTPPKR
jgi:hypothetical protein